MRFTVALPVRDEAGVLEELHERLTEACSSTGEAYEILYVDDGSTDGSRKILQRLAYVDSHTSVVGLSRNFGHGAALAAAIDLASGESVILMDADLQDDPGAIPELLRIQSEQDADVVYAVRAGRRETLLMRLLFSVFHVLMARSATYTLPAHAGSFGLIGPRALSEIRRMTERLRYFPGLRAFVGFKQVAVEIPRGKRYDDKSRVGFRGLLRLAGAAFFAESRAPVTVLYWLSAMSLLAAAGVGAYVAIAKIQGFAVVAWASIMTAVAFFSSVIILGQALMCEYLSRVYEEVRGRPLYVVETIVRGSDVID